jgi:molybdate transport system substrate-binding protein
MRSFLRKNVGWAAGFLAMAACSGSGTEGNTVLVSAAASLTDAFAEIEILFETENPGIDLILNLGSSSSLREQILEGAPVDVYASANDANMAQVIEAGAATASTVFALNSLQIAVPRGNPAGIDGLEDFANPDLLIGLCAESVPCGEFGRQVLANAGITPSIDTNEPDVRALLTKIEAGELDAGITYVTDVLSTGGDVAGIDIPPGVNVVAEYPVAVLTEAPQPSLARAVVSLLISESGREILERHGFSSP